MFGLRLAFTTRAVGHCDRRHDPAGDGANVRPGLEGIDRGLETAARTLGASRGDVFATITLPLMSPGLLTAVAIGFTAALGEFGAVIIFAANIEGETRTLPLAIYTSLQHLGPRRGGTARRDVDRAGAHRPRRERMAGGALRRRLGGAMRQRARPFLPVTPRTIAVDIRLRRDDSASTRLRAAGRPE